VAASQSTAVIFYIFINCGGESNRDAIYYGGKSKFAAEYVAVHHISPLHVTAVSHLK
jgi:hypothetical protein